MLTAFFASQNGTNKTVPKTLTYQFENNSGMGLSIIQGNPEKSTYFKNCKCTF